MCYATALAQAVAAAHYVLGCGQSSHVRGQSCPPTRAGGPELESRARIPWSPSMGREPVERDGDGDPGGGRTTGERSRGHDGGGAAPLPAYVELGRRVRG